MRDRLYLAWMRRLQLFLAAAPKATARKAH